MDDSVTIDQTIRQLRYDFFKLSKAEQFFVLCEHHCVTESMLEQIGFNFFVEGFNHALVQGNIDSIANDRRVKEMRDQRVSAKPG